MTRKPTPKGKKIRHYAQVARLRIETAFVEFDHVDEVSLGDQKQRGAHRKAEQVAAKLSEDAWQSEPIDDALYAPFVLTLLTQTDIERIKEEDAEGIPDAEAETDVIGETRFLLLKADVFSGEGDLILQPWFVTADPNLMMSDLTSDWICDLQNLGLTYLSERTDELLSGAQPNLSDAMLFGVAPKRRKKPKPE